MPLDTYKLFQSNGGSLEEIDSVVSVWDLFKWQESFSQLSYSLVISYKLAANRLGYVFITFKNFFPNAFYQFPQFFWVRLGLNFIKLLQMKSVPLRKDLELSVLWPDSPSRKTLLARAVELKVVTM